MAPEVDAQQCVDTMSLTRAAAYRTPSGFEGVISFTGTLKGLKSKLFNASVNPKLGVTVVCGYIDEDSKIYVAGADPRLRTEVETELRKSLRDDASSSLGESR